MAHPRTARATALLILVAAATATAQPQSERRAALLVYPRVEVGASPNVDTLVYLANAADSAINAYCIYTDGSGTCSGTNVPCQTNATCPVLGQDCIIECSRTDFLVTLTPHQVLGWTAETGLDGAVPPVAAPFLGELRCLETDAQRVPVAANDLLGSAEILGVGVGSARYEPIGVRSTGFNDGDTRLCLGSDTAGCPTAEYAACPETLLLNHFFEGAGVLGSPAANRLTLVPCTAFYQPRLGQPAPDRVAVDVTLTLVNEFEQQTEITRGISCYGSISLSHFPAFSVAAQGTVGGQTFIRGSQTDADAGSGLLGVAVQALAGPLGSVSSGHGLATVGVAATPDPIVLTDF
jgi:hypothetical protein